MPEYTLPGGGPNPDPYGGDELTREVCHRCNGTGCVDTPYSGSDPDCPQCGGEGWVPL